MDFSELSAEDIEDDSQESNSQPPVFFFFFVMLLGIDVNLKHTYTLSSVNGLKKISVKQSTVFNPPDLVHTTRLSGHPPWLKKNTFVKTDHLLTIFP